MDVSYTVRKPKDPAPAPLLNPSTSPSVPTATPTLRPRRPCAWEPGRSAGLPREEASHIGKGLEGALGLGSQGNSECVGGRGRAQRSCPVPSPRVSPCDPQGDSRPGSGLHRGRKGERGEAESALRSPDRGFTPPWPHISSWGLCGLRVGDKAEALPRGIPKGSGLLWVARIPPLPWLLGWVKSLHFSDLSLLI